MQGGSGKAPQHGVRTAMRILFVVPYVPSPVRVRSYNFVRSLAQLGHEVTVLSPACSPDDGDWAAHLRRHGIGIEIFPLPRHRSLANCMAAVPSREPLQAAYSWNRALARRSAELALGNGEASFDIVHVEHLRGARYGLYLKAQAAVCGRRLPLVYDSVDCISYLFGQAAAMSRQPLRRLLAAFEFGRTRSYESYLLGRFEHVLVTSPVDREALLALQPAGPGRPPCVSVVPMGVDLDYFTPGLAELREPATLVVSGKMSYHANVAMVDCLMREIMPQVWSRRPEVRVLIVGKDPPARVRAYGRHPEVTVTGFVPDMRPYLQRATAAVAPVVYGAGIQNKVLEAMACATAVVATPAAVRALVGAPEAHARVAGDAHSFANAVLELLADDGRRRSLAAAGRRYVEENYARTKIAGRVADIYRQALALEETPPAHYPVSPQYSDR